MRFPSRYLVILVVLVVLPPLSTAAGQGVDVEADDTFSVPGGGILTYSAEVVKDESKTYAIRYSGGPKWVVDQEHPRSHWHKIPTLEEIDLHMASAITADEMAYIASLKSVSTLRITETVFERRALDPLSRMTWLKSLWIDCGSHLSRLNSKSHDLTRYEYPRADFFGFLDKLAELEVLALWPECDEETFVRITRLKNLKWLSLGTFGKISEKNAAEFARLRNLEYLSLPDLDAPTPLLKALRNHPQLKELSIARVNLDKTDVESIASMKVLGKLYVQGDQIESLTPLGKLRNLKTLHLRFKDIRDADGYKFLANLPNLEDVILTGVAADDGFTLEPLRGSRHLAELGADAILRDEDIAILESMPNLKALGVRNTADSEWVKTVKRRMPDLKVGAAAPQGSR